MEEAMQAALSNRETAESYHNSHAHNLPEITIYSNVAIQNPNTKLWDIYDIDHTADTTSRHTADTYLCGIVDFYVAYEL